MGRGRIGRCCIRTETVATDDDHRRIHVRGDYGNQAIHAVHAVHRAPPAAQKRRPSRPTRTRSGGTLPQKQNTTRLKETKHPQRESDPHMQYRTLPGIRSKVSEIFPELAAFRKNGCNRILWVSTGDCRPRFRQANSELATTVPGCRFGEAVFPNRGRQSPVAVQSYPPENSVTLRQNFRVANRASSVHSGHVRVDRVRAEFQKSCVRLGRPQVVRPAVNENSRPNVRAAAGVFTRLEVTWSP